MTQPKKRFYPFSQNNDNSSSPIVQVAKVRKLETNLSSFFSLTMSQDVIPSSKIKVSLKKEKTNLTKEEALSNANKNKEFEGGKSQSISFIFFIHIV